MLERADVHGDMGLSMTHTDAADLLRWAEQRLSTLQTDHERSLVAENQRLTRIADHTRAMAHAADTEKAEAKHWRERAEKAEAEVQRQLNLLRDDK